MSKALTIGLALGVGVVVGVIGAQMMNPAAPTAPPVEAKTDAPLPTQLSSVPDAVGTQDISGPYEVVQRLAAGSRHAAGPREVDLWRRARVFAESPDRVFLLGGGELPNMRAPAGAGICAMSARTCSSPSAVCRGATPTRPHPRATAARARIRRRAWKPGRASRRPSASSASMRAGITRSSSSTAKARSSRTGRNGTTCSSVRTPSTSARTMRRSVSGSSMTTRMRSTSSPTTASSSADDRHAQRAGRRCDAFQPADLHRLGAGRELLRRRRLQRHARREVRQGRQVHVRFRPGRRSGQGNAPRLHEQRSRRCRRRRDATACSSTTATTTASRSSTRTANISREWKINVRAVEPAFRPYRRRRQPRGLRSQHPQDGQIRPRRATHLLVGHDRRVPRHALGRARHGHRPGRQHLCRRSRTPGASRNSARAPAPIPQL